MFKANVIVSKFKILTVLNVKTFLQRLSEQEEYLNVQVKELEANVLATAPDQKKQKLLEENVTAFKTGMLKDIHFFFPLCGQKQVCNIQNV